MQPAGQPRARTMVIWNTHGTRTQGTLMEHSLKEHSRLQYPWVVGVTSGQVCQFRSEKGNSKKLGSGNSHIDLRSVCYSIAYGSGWAGLGWTGLAVVWFSYLGKSFHSRCSTADLYLKIPPEIPPCVSNYLSSCGHTTQWM